MLRPLPSRSLEQSTGDEAVPTVCPAADPDLSLALALQAGDETALNSLMERHQNGLFRFVCRYLMNQTQAADIVQETFVRAFFRIGQFQPLGTFAAWLYRIALNLCRDHARSGPAKKARLTLSLSEDGAVSPAAAKSNAADPSREVANREEMRLLEAAIAELPHNLKSALILTALEGLSQQECAALLGVTPKAVETRVYRARRLLARKMEMAMR